MLDSLDAGAQGIDEGNTQAFATVEEAIQAGEDTLRAGPASRAAALNRGSGLPPKF